MKVILEGGNKALIGLINELKLKMRRNKIKYSYVTEEKPKKKLSKDEVFVGKIEEVKEYKEVIITNEMQNEKPRRKKVEKKTQSKSKK